MAVCVNCNTENSSTAKFCKSCGTSTAKPAPAGDIASQQVHCPSCSAPAASGGRFCKQCGASLSGAAITSSSSTATTETFSASRTAEELPFAQPDTTPLQEDTQAVRSGNVETPTTAETALTNEQNVVAKSTGTSDTAAQSASRSRHLVIIILAATVMAGLLGGGIYWWNQSGKPADSVPAQAASSASASASAAAAASSQAAAVSASVSIPAVNADKVAAQAPSEVVAQPGSAPAVSATTASAASVPPASIEPAPSIRLQARHVPPHPKAEPKPIPSAGNKDALAGKVAALLAKADGYIASQQYDKAIATGENALVLDPDNAPAKALIRRAKAKQLEALKTGTSLE